MEKIITIMVMDTKLNKILELRLRFIEKIKVSTIITINTKKNIFSKFLIMVIKNKNSLLKKLCLEPSTTAKKVFPKNSPKIASVTMGSK